MPALRRSRTIAGTTLILLGLFLFWIEHAEGIGSSMSLLAMGGLFLAGYLHKRAFGLLIPGCLLLGLGSAAVLEHRFSWIERPQTVGLGLGFVAAFVIAAIYERRAPWWPLVPGAALTLVGLSVGEEAFRFLFSHGWPAVLVIVGVLFLLGALGGSRRQGAAGG